MLADAIVNFALFLPVGWLLHRAARRLGLPPGARLLVVLFVGGLFSLSIETVQYVVANRHAPRWNFATRHGIDIAMNSVGALAGALGAARFNARRA